MAEKSVENEIKTGNESSDEHSNSNSYYNDVLLTIKCDIQDVNFDDFFGSEQSVKMLLNDIVHPIQCSTSSPQMDEHKKKQHFPLFLYGSPGAGKTMLMHATAKMSDVQLFVFNAWNLQSRIIGRVDNAQKCIETVFRIVEDYPRPCLLCLEDLEVFSKNEMHFEKGRATLLNQIQEGLSDNVYLIGTTQRPWMVDTHLRKYFVMKSGSFIHLPDRIARKQLLHKLLEKNGTSHNLTEADIDQIAEKTKDYCGADLLCLVKSASFGVLKDITNSTHFRIVKVQTDKVPVQTMDVNGIARLKSDSEETGTSESRPVSDSLEQTKSKILTSQEQGNVELVEKYEPCQPQDEGAIAMSFSDIPLDKLYIEYSISLHSFNQALADSKSTILEDELEMYRKFEEEFLPKEI